MLQSEVHGAWAMSRARLPRASSIDSTGSTLWFLRIGFSNSQTFLSWPNGDLGSTRKACETQADFFAHFRLRSHPFLPEWPSA